jgi:hypothetical protein
MPKPKTGQPDFVTVSYTPTFEDFRYADFQLEGTDPQHQVMRLWSLGDAADGFTPCHVDYGHYEPSMVDGFMQLNFIRTGERSVQGTTMPAVDGIIRQCDFLPVVNQILRDVPPVPQHPISQELQVVHGLPMRPRAREIS